jgi:predicted DNA-binding transcriptional regulator YafY
LEPAMAEPVPHGRGSRNSSWLVLRRGLALVRGLLRGPASAADLLAAVKHDLGPDAYSAEAKAALLAFKHDRAALKEHLGIEIRFNRREGVYELAGLGDTPWLDLSDEALGVIALLYGTFGQTGPATASVRQFLDLIVGLLPEERLPILRSRRQVLHIELRELDEHSLSERARQVVAQAIAERRRLGFRYQAAAQDDRQPRYHEVEPYEMVLREGHYYLEAYDLFSRGEQHGRVKQERLRYFRMQGVLDDDMLQVLPERLPPGRHRAKSFPVRYHLAAPAARHGVSPHFADTQVELQTDGSAIVTATITDIWDAVRTLLRYGDSCTVLGGDEVLGEMRKRVAGMARNYGLLAFEAE